MTVEEFEAMIRRRLQDAGIDSRKPDPALAWTIFKECSTTPVECDDSYLFWEAADDYFDYVREFRHHPDSGAVWHEQVTIHFTCSEPYHFGADSVVLFSRDQSDNDTFFRVVERQPEFIRGQAFEHWSMEVRLDGC